MSVIQRWACCCWPDRLHVPWIQPALDAARYQAGHHRQRIPSLALLPPDAMPLARWRDSCGHCPACMRYPKRCAHASLYKPRPGMKLHGLPSAQYNQSVLRGQRSEMRSTQPVRGGAAAILHPVPAHCCCPIFYLEVIFGVFQVFHSKLRRVSQACPPAQYAIGAINKVWISEPCTVLAAMTYYRLTSSSNCQTTLRP